MAAKFMLLYGTVREAFLTSSKATVLNEMYLNVSLAVFTLSLEG